MSYVLGKMFRKTFLGGTYHGLFSYVTEGGQKERTLRSKREPRDAGEPRGPKKKGGTKPRMSRESPIYDRGDTINSP